MMCVDTYINHNGNDRFFTRAATEHQKNVICADRYAFYEHDYDELDAENEPFSYATTARNPEPTQEEIKKIFTLYKKADKKTNKRIYSIRSISKMMGISYYHVEKILKIQKKDSTKC